MIGKETDGKLDYTLIPLELLHQVAKVREYGNKKYRGADTWMHVPRGEYVKAIFRHLVSYLCGVQRDQETGLHHMAHIACNCAFILEIDE